MWHLLFSLLLIFTVRVACKFANIYRGGMADLAGERINNSNARFAVNVEFHVLVKGMVVVFKTVDLFYSISL